MCLTLNKVLNKSILITGVTQEILGPDLLVLLRGEETLKKI
jgi:hypothetical protein